MRAIGLLTLFVAIQFLAPTVLAGESCDHALFKVYSGKLQGAVDRFGKVKIPPRYEFVSMGEYSSMAKAVPPFPAKLPGEKIGFIDDKGNWIIRPKYEGATVFKGGVSAVIESYQKAYLINSGGERVGEIWDEISLPDSGVATTRRSSKIFYLSNKGSVLFQSPSDPLSPKDSSKKELMSDDDLVFFSFHDGLAPFRKGERWGLINSSGAIVANEQFDTVSVQKGFAIVTLGERQGIIDGAGHYILNPSRVGIQRCENEEKICSVQNLGTFDFRLFSVKAKKYLPGVYSDIRGCSEGLCVVGKNEGKGCSTLKQCFYAVNVDGRVITKLPAASGFVSEFHEGYASFSDFKDKSFTMGFVNKKGGVSISPQFDNAISMFECGLARADISGRVGLINKKGEFVWNPQ